MSEQMTTSFDLTEDEVLTVIDSLNDRLETLEDLLQFEQSQNLEPNEGLSEARRDVQIVLDIFSRE